MSQIVNPFQYIADPTKGRPIFNAKMFFGVPDTDPTIASNQKLVRAIQENGNVVSLPQPVSTGSGGVPEFQGSPIVLDVDGDYSFVVLDRFDDQVYEIPRVENIAEGSEGFSGVVATESVELTAGQVTIVLLSLGANESVFYVQTELSDQGFLKKDTDYTVINSTTIELNQSYNAGDFIVARQNDPTGQLVQIVVGAASLLVFPDLATAASSAVSGELTEGENVTLNGNATEGDGLGGDKYKVILTTSPNDGVNFLDLNGTLQLELINNLYRFQNYSEKIATAQVATSIMNINLNDGVIQIVTLTESISDVVFINYNPDSNYASTVTLRITQDGTGGWGVTWPSTIKWPGGSVPTVTITAGAVDEYIFTTFDAGTTWSGKTAGQDIS